MNIRLANKWDIPTIKDMLRHYSREGGYTLLQEHDENHVEQLLTGIIAGAGRIIMADGDEPHGMLISMRVPNIWNPKLLFETELAFWVDPDYRGSRAAYQMLKYYRDYPLSGCRAQTVSTHDPELFNPGRWGYQPWDTHFVKELQCPEQ